MSGAPEEDSSSSEEEDVAVDEAKVQEFENKILANPYDYASHTDLLILLNQGGDVDRCREVRERMSGLFPLTPEMWLSWIKQERLFLPLHPQRVKDTLKTLYARSIKDYPSVLLWCQYLSDVVEILDYSEERTRELFEQGLSEVGLHVTQGGQLWEQYRQYEETLFETIRDKLETDTDNRDLLQDLYNKQRTRVENIFQRQLAVPLNGLEYLMTEYKEWLGEAQVSPSLQNRHEAALKKRELVTKYEEALAMTAPPHEEEYHHYIEYERKQGDPARVMCLMERALSDNPLNSTRWLDYLQYLDQVLKVKSVVLTVYSRAIRNIPWVVDVWTQYMLAQQRYKLHFSHIEESLEDALKSGFPNSASYLSLWRCYLACHWRQERFKPLETNGSLDQHLDNNPLNQAFQKAVNFMNQHFGEEGDPTGALTRFMAECEGLRDDLISCRQLMAGLFESKIYKEQATIWLDHVRMELKWGSVEEARRVLQKAIQCNTDNTQLLLDQFLEFERLHGTLESYDNAALKCRRQQKKLQQLQEKKAAREKSKDTARQENPKNKQSQKKRKISSEKGGSDVAKHRKPNTADKTPPKPRDKAPSKAPPTPSSDKVEPDVTKYHVTVFVSNLSYSATEQDLNETFRKVGDIVDIRLVKSPNNNSRGFGYVEFHTREEVMSALEMDRVEILGRPCYVSECKEKSAGTPAQFKFSTGMETHKLYVSNLPYSTTEDQVREMFGKVDKIKGVRMVTTKGGKFKGYCYVEYVASDAARKAVLELNDTELEGRKMQVAISNPPTASKAGGSRIFPEKEDGLFKRKVKMNFMVPRAVSKPAVSKPPGRKAAASETGSSGETAASATGSSGENVASATGSSGENVASETGTQPKPSEDSESGPASTQGTVVPKAMLSNDHFSKLFNK